MPAKGPDHNHAGTHALGLISKQALPQHHVLRQPVPANAHHTQGAQTRTRRAFKQRECTVTQETTSQPQEINTQHSARHRLTN